MHANGHRSPNLGIRLEAFVASKPTSRAMLSFLRSRLISILRESPAEKELTTDAGMDATIITAGTTEYSEMAGEDPAAFPDIRTFAEEKYTRGDDGWHRPRHDSPGVVAPARLGGAFAIWGDHRRPLGAGSREGNTGRNRWPAARAVDRTMPEQGGPHDQGAEMPVVPLYKAMTLLESEPRFFG